MAAYGHSQYANVCASSKLAVSEAELRTTGRSWHPRQKNQAIKMHVPVRRRELALHQDPAGENFLHNSSVQEGIAKTQKYRDVARRVEHNKRRVGKTMIEKIVIVMAFFLILFVLAVLVAGQGGSRSVLGSINILDSGPAPVSLWPTLFQPTLGLFMAGAVVSAVFGCRSKNADS